MLDGISKTQLHLLCKIERGRRATLAEGCSGISGSSQGRQPACGKWRKWLWSESFAVLTGDNKRAKDNMIGAVVAILCAWILSDYV